MESSNGKTVIELENLGLNIIIVFFFSSSFQLISKYCVVDRLCWNIYVFIYSTKNKINNCEFKPSPPQTYYGLQSADDPQYRDQIETAIVLLYTFDPTITLNELVALKPGRKYMYINILYDGGWAYG